MHPENTFLHLSGHCLALYPILFQPHAGHLPLHPGFVQLECDLWGPAWVLDMSSWLHLEIPSSQPRPSGYCLCPLNWE